MQYGFIGCGNMGGAIAQALAKSTKEIILTDRSGKARQTAQELSVSYGSLEEAASCDVVFLGVKPQGMAEILQKLSPIFQARKPLLISMAAGLTVAGVEAMAGGKLPVVRIMPNTPVAVGKGVILYCHNALVDKATFGQVLADLAPAGLLDPVEEGWMDAACSVSGCGPAYCYMFAQALAQGGALQGLPEEKALRYAAATMLGAAEMLLATGEAPAALRQKVCSPGGSTIEGVKVLEAGGFFPLVEECIAVAYRRNLELGKS